MSGRQLARAVLAQTGVEIRLTLRRGESLLITLLVPVLLLIFFASLGIVPAESGRPVDFLLPGMLSLAIIATGMVSVGIATAYERYYGVLKLLGGSPLPRGGLILAKVLSVVLFEAVQVAILLIVASVGYGWRPQGAFGLVLLAFVLGTAAFTGLGLGMAGGLRAEMTLAGANGLYLIFLLLGDVVLPLSHLPGPLRILAHILPATPLTDALRAAMSGTALTAAFWPNVVEVAAWAIALVALAALTFRWERSRYMFFTPAATVWDEFRRPSCLRARRFSSGVLESGGADSGRRAMAEATVLDCGPLVEGLERDLGVSLEIIALALDVDRRTVERWRANQSVPQGKTRQRLAELMALRDRLMRTFSTAEAVQGWLGADSRYLGGFTPLEALRAGRLDRVRADLDGLTAGIYL